MEGFDITFLVSKKIKSQFKEIALLNWGKKYIFEKLSQFSKSVNADTDLTSTTIRDPSWRSLQVDDLLKSKEKIGERVMHAYILPHMMSQLNIS